MEIVIDTVDDFIEYYEQGYRHGKQGIKDIYKLSDKTFYRHIGYGKSEVTKIKFKKTLADKIQAAYSTDDRITKDHIVLSAGRQLFNEHEVFEYLVRTGRFDMYVNVIDNNDPDKRGFLLINQIGMREKNKQYLLDNYEKIKMYLWQAHKTEQINRLKVLGREYDLSDNTDKKRYKDRLSREPSLRFIVCGVSLYVSLQHGAYFHENIKEITELFFNDRKDEQLEFELVNDEYLK